MNKISNADIAYFVISAMKAYEESRNKEILIIDAKNKIYDLCAKLYDKAYTGEK